MEVLILGLVALGLPLGALWAYVWRNQRAYLAEKAYEQGWHACASWAGRDDLHADTDSPAYAYERDLRLARLL